MSQPAVAVRSSEAAAPEIAVSEEDALEQALLWICAHHERPCTSAELWSGLPRTPTMTPSLAVRALHGLGLQAGLVRRKPEELFSYLMPVVVLCRGGGACVLTRRLENTSPRAEVRYEVVLPEAGNGRAVMTARELAERYTGYCLLVKPAPRPDLRDDEPLPQSPSHWLWGTLWQYKSYFVSTVVAALLINVLTLAITFFTMNVYDRVVPNQTYATLWALAVGVALAIVFEFIARNVRTYVIDVAGKKADLVLGSLLFRQAMATRLEFRPAHTGSFAYQLREFEAVRDFATSATLAVLTDLPFIFLFVWVTSMVAGSLMWVLLLSIPLVIIVSVLVQWPLAKVMQENMREAAHKQGVVIEAVEGIEALKAAGAEGFMQQKWEHYSALTAASSMKSRMLNALSSNAVMTITQLCTVAMVVWGVYLIGAGQLTLGALIGAVILSNRALGPLGMVVGLALRFQHAKVALTTLNRLMRQPVEREPTRTYLACPALAQGLRMENLSFSYPAAPGLKIRPALQQVSLQIAAGERIAVLGRVGSGKSTLLRLLAGLYLPQEGQVQADGIDIRQIDPGSWRRAVGFVGQEPRLFFGTLRENILMAHPQAGNEALLRVARMTGLDALAASHPLGFDMPIGEMGRGLSGGQQQLVALARCLLAQPQVLLMDEPTSAMDTQTEAVFMHKLMAAITGRSFVLVTHRMPLLVLVDRVILMEDGRIVADGPRDRVLAMLSGNAKAAAAAAGETS